MESKPKRFTFTISANLHRAFKASCARNGSLMGDVLCELLEKELDHQDRREASLATRTKSRQGAEA